MTENADVVCASAKARSLRSIMLVGTASSVGKSVLCAALCRIFAQDGIRVAPFKAQNMSLNAAVTPAGAEIGRAQAMQAEAAGILPSEHMNPVLLKPTGDMQSQVIVQGQVLGNQAARDYFADRKERLWQAVCESYAHLHERYELLVLEGAGSPVELNLKQRDIANMRVAQMAGAAVILVADIDRGGVFASVLGTLMLLEPSERASVCGIIVNRFRGDPALFAQGVRMLEERAGVPVLGVIPYIHDLQVDEEDSVGLSAQRYQRDRAGRSPATEHLQIAVVRLPYIANFTDLDPLFVESGVDTYFTAQPQDVLAADAVIVPGSKNTIADLLWLQQSGMAAAILQADRAGKQILGICGGFQMLGELVRDPQGRESLVPEARGLGLHPGVTTMAATKTTRLVRGTLADGSGIAVDGYEIHMGETVGIPLACAFAQIADSASAARNLHRPDGFSGDAGRVIGTYLHGVLHNDAFRLTWLNRVRRARNLPVQEQTMTMEAVRTAAYDHLAAVVREHLDLAAIYAAIGFTR